MDTLPLALVIASAVSHAAWNVMAKGGGDKESLLWLMTSSSILTLLPIFALVLPEWGLPLKALPFIVVSALAETLYFVSLGRAYELGDLSVVYPLARSSPLFLTLLAVVVLNERITNWGLAGILLILLGVYMIHLRSLSPGDLLAPIRSLSGRASQYAILTALGTTIYSLSDKMGVTIVDPFLYAFWLEFFIAGLLGFVILRRRSWEGIVAEWRRSKVQAIVGGFLMRFGYVLVLFAMSMVQVSYVLALRQISVVLGAAAGVILLKESYGRVRVLSSIIMFTGVYILAILA
jgi:drug/metabolite transporter (DMT)-like permease